MKNKMTFLSILATIAGIMMALANLPQAVKIFKRKSAKDVSIITFGLITIGAFVWFLYGIEIDNVAVWLSNGIGFVACLAVVIGWFIYK